MSECPKFTELNELASFGNGGKIVFATDDWFAAAENMINDTDPIFIADKYTDFGKWMDGWETRRRRLSGHDWCIIKLASTSTVNGFHVDTAFFTGNYAPRISIQGARLTEKEEKLIPKRKPDMMGTACSPKDLDAMDRLQSDEWAVLLPRTELNSGYENSRHNFFAIETNEICSHIRVNIYPDGGIARLRVYGVIRPDAHVFANKASIDLMALKNGGICVSYSNAHYGHPRNLIKPNRGINMGDGWETGRRLDRPAILEADENGILKLPGHEWAVFQLAGTGTIESIEVDTCHFKGNFPDSVKIEGLLLRESTSLIGASWIPILNKQKLSAHKQHYYKNEIQNRGPFNFVMITIAPDGGISRVRLNGHIIMEELSDE